MNQLPRASDYPTETPEQVNATLGKQGSGQNLDPYGTAQVTNGGVRLRDVEPNTSGRASGTPDLQGEDATGLTPYGDITAPQLQGTINRVPNG